jgi:hypothetical protein
VRRNARLSAKDRTDAHATAQHSRLRLRPDQAKTRRRRAP